MFSSDDIEFEITDADRSAAIVVVTTPVGLIEICTEVVVTDRTLIANRTHVTGLRAGGLTRSGMNAIAQRIMEMVDVDTIIVIGENRATGARPGHRPLPLRFRRIRIDHDARRNR